jgi:hypothetical protein
MENVVSIPFLICELNDLICWVGTVTVIGTFFCRLTHRVQLTFFSGQPFILAPFFLLLLRHVRSILYTCKRKGILNGRGAADY